MTEWFGPVKNGNLETVKFLSFENVHNELFSQTNYLSKQLVTRTMDHRDGKILRCMECKEWAIYSPQCNSPISCEFCMGLK